MAADGRVSTRIRKADHTRLRMIAGRWSQETGRNYSIYSVIHALLEYGDQVGPPPEVFPAPMEGAADGR